MSLFGSGIDYRNNPIMTELLERIQKEEVRSYAILSEFLLTNFSVDRTTGNTKGGRVVYSERGYMPLKMGQIADLNKQILEAVKALPNVKKVRKNHPASFVTDYINRNESKTYPIYKAYDIEFYAEKPELKSW